MARPSKPAAIIAAEKKSHKTKSELKARAEAEAELLSGERLSERQEVKDNKIAHAEFLRVSKLMKAIGKDDALYSSGINTYCMLYSEINELGKNMQQLDLTAGLLKESFEGLIDNREVCPDDIISFEKSYTRLVSQRISLCSMIDKKRKMMLDIDKEYCMTLSAALRSIPKQPEKKQSALVSVLFGSDEDDDDE